MRHRSSIASRSLYCAVTLDETPRGAAKMHSRADAPPISHVIDEFEAACFEVARNPSRQWGHAIVWGGGLLAMRATSRSAESRSAMWKMNPAFGQVTSRQG